MRLAGPPRLPGPACAKFHKETYDGRRGPGPRARTGMAEMVERVSPRRPQVSRRAQLRRSTRRPQAAPARNAPAGRVGPEIRMIQHVVRALLAPFGLTVGRTLPGGQLIDPRQQDAFESAFARVRANTMLNRQRSCLLFELTRHLITSGIPGALVEGGAWKGG